MSESGGAFIREAPPDMYDSDMYDLGEQISNSGHRAGWTKHF